MEKIKLLLYCTKQPLYLEKNPDFIVKMGKPKYIVSKTNEYIEDMCLNGKIVAECDFEVEEIKLPTLTLNEDLNDLLIKSAKEKEILKQSCLSYKEFADYVRFSDKYYAIHIKNLNIFDKPRELNCYFLEGKPVKISDDLKLSTAKAIKQAPQNMCYVRGCNTGEKYILISIRAEWLCKILNGEKTIELRKKVLKEMVK